MEDNNVLDGSTDKVTVKQVAMKWGVILGVLSIVLFVIGAMADLTNNSAFRWLGIIPTVIVFVLAHKEFKNNGDGFMSYGQGLGIGTLIAVVSSVISAVFTFIYIKFIDLAYIERMQDGMIAQWETQGMTDDQIDQALKMSSMFMSPTMIFIFAIVMGVFFGFILSLIVSAFTKNSNPELDM